MVNWVPYFSCTEVLRRFLRSLGAQGDNGQSCCVAMGLLMAAEAGPVWSDPVWTWPFCSGRWGGHCGVVGSRGCSACAEHGPVWDKSGQCLLPVTKGGWVCPDSSLMSVGHQGLLRGWC